MDDGVRTMICGDPTGSDPILTILMILMAEFLNVADGNELHLKQAFAESIVQNGILTCKRLGATQEIVLHFAPVGLWLHVRLAKQRFRARRNCEAA